MKPGTPLSASFLNDLHLLGGLAIFQKCPIPSSEVSFSKGTNLLFHDIETTGIHVNALKQEGQRTLPV
jgi:hypothetical protein